MISIKEAIEESHLFNSICNMETKKAVKWLKGQLKTRNLPESENGVRKLADHHIVNPLVATGLHAVADYLGANL